MTFETTVHSLSKESHFCSMTPGKDRYPSGVIRNLIILLNKSTNTFHSAETSATEVKLPTTFYTTISTNLKFLRWHWDIKEVDLRSREPLRWPELGAGFLTVERHWWSFHLRQFLFIELNRCRIHLRKLLLLLVQWQVRGGGIVVRVQGEFSPRHVFLDKG